MKNLYKAALLAVLGITAVSSAQASSDLILGFNDVTLGGSANDYVVDLGTANFTTSTTFSTSFSGSSFNSAFGADANALNHVSAGIVGTPNATTLFQTSPLLGDPAFAATTSSFPNAVNDINAVALGVYSSTSASGWTANIAQSSTQTGTSSSSSLAGSTANPMLQLSSGVTTETLWEATESGSGRNKVVSGWEDIGTFTINANTDTVSFTGADVSAVPEPSTYGLLAGAGLLVVALRRNFSTKNA
jgi:hypothetical protein